MVSLTTKHTEFTETRKNTLCVLCDFVVRKPCIKVNHEAHQVHKEELRSMTENEISKIVVDCAYKVRKTLGAGLLESSYEACLAFEINKRGLSIVSQKALPLIYEEVKLEVGYRIDLLVENKLIVEIKAVEGLHDIHLAQILTYLKLAECKLGLLINFNVPLIKNGIRRVING